MGDTTSCLLFSELFQLIERTKMPKEVRKELAESILSMSRGYDFTTYELEADDLLLKLGLAKLDSEGSVLYKGEDYD